jgi:hypothetical protein
VGLVVAGWSEPGAPDDKLTWLGGPRPTVSCGGWCWEIAGGFERARGLSRTNSYSETDDVLSSWSSQCRGWGLRTEPRSQALEVGLEEELGDDWGNVGCLVH